MSEAEAVSVHPRCAEEFSVERPRDVRSPSYIQKIERTVDLLRFCRHRLAAIRMRVHGASPAFGELLVRRALGHLGYSGVLSGGDVVFLHVANVPLAREKAHDHGIEKDLIARLSATLAELCGDGPRVRLLISVAHVWSDEIGDADDLVALLTRSAPKTDITLPVEGRRNVVDDARTTRELRAAAV